MLKKYGVGDWGGHTIVQLNAASDALENWSLSGLVGGRVDGGW